MGDSIEVPVNTWIYRFIAWALSLAAMILSAIAVASCSFIRKEENDGSVEYTGLYRYPISSTYCSSVLYFYDQNTIEELDGSWKAAMAFATVAPLLGGVAMLILCLQVCCKLNKCIWIIVAVLEFVAAGVQAITFIVFNSGFCKTERGLYEEKPAEGVDDPDVKCYIDEGAKQAIAAIVLYIFAGIVLCCTPPPNYPLFKITNPNADEEEQVKQQQPTVVSPPPPPQQQYQSPPTPQQYQSHPAPVQQQPQVPMGVPAD